MASVRRRDRRQGKPWKLIAALIVVAATAGHLAFSSGPAPHLEIIVGLPGIGPSTPVTVRASEASRGLSLLVVEAIQGDNRVELGRSSFVERPVWKIWTHGKTETEIELLVGAETLDWLRRGELTLSATAQGSGAWVLGARSSHREVDVAVDLSAPRPEILSSSIWVNQGGVAVVSWSQPEDTVRSGIRAGDAYFEAFQVEGDENARVALFAAPWNLSDSSELEIVLWDLLGNLSATSFVDGMKSRPVVEDDIEVPDRFLERVVPAMLDADDSILEADELVDTYVWINSELRSRNSQALVELARSSVPERLWDGDFIQLPNSKVMAGFAEQRTYLYKASVIDAQTHLGYDLASLRRAPVPAANSGRVMLAEAFGIFGNCVVLDHGFGVMTLYAHLSAIDVALGDEVVTGDTLGRTGRTGLAGGDHLHYGVYVQGVAVDPLEWWDAGFIERNVIAPLEEQRG